jgi:hypothetical protein
MHHSLSFEWPECDQGLNHHSRFVIKPMASAHQDSESSSQGGLNGWLLPVLLVSAIA